MFIKEYEFDITVMREITIYLLISDRKKRVICLSDRKYKGEIYYFVFLCSIWFSYNSDTTVKCIINHI